MIWSDYLPVLDATFLHRCENKFNDCSTRLDHPDQLLDCVGVNLVMNFLNLQPPFGSFSMFLHVIIPVWFFLVKSDFFNFLIGAISA